MNHAYPRQIASSSKCIMQIMHELQSLSFLFRDTATWPPTSPRNVGYGIYIYINYELFTCTLRPSVILCPLRHKMKVPLQRPSGPYHEICGSDEAKERVCQGSTDNHCNSLIVVGSCTIQLNANVGEVAGHTLPYSSYPVPNP